MLYGLAPERPSAQGLSQATRLAGHDGCETGWIVDRGRRRADGDHEVVRLVDVVEVVEEARDLCGRGGEHVADLDTLVVGVGSRPDHDGPRRAKCVRFRALRVTRAAIRGSVLNGSL